MTGLNPDEDLQALKYMIEYIYQNYGTKLTLEKIALSGKVCRSKCCLIFKKFLNQTPIDFLNLYRLEVSMNLLRDSLASVTDIAFSCGFNSPSYYSKIFCQYKGCTPTAYRMENQPKKHL